MMVKQKTTKERDRDEETETDDRQRTTKKQTETGTETEEDIPPSLVNDLQISQTINSQSTSGQRNNTDWESNGGLIGASLTSILYDNFFSFGKFLAPQ